MGKKIAPGENTQSGARTAFTDEQIDHIRAKLLELIPQGWTIRQVLAEPDMCSMTYLYRDLHHPEEADDRSLVRGDRWHIS